MTSADDIDTASRVNILRAFPRAQTGQRQIRISVLDFKGDWRDALTRLLDTVAA